MSVEPATVEALQAEIVLHDAIHVRGAGSKSPPPSEGTAVSLRALRGIIEYSPDECVISTLAGTPLADLDRALAAHGQYLPFDPPLAAAGATIGGTVAAGLSGPLRYRYGGVRDFVIGARVIDGEGRSIRSGGKVVKNAAGFLLHHAMVGSAGRFAVLSELTFKVFPQPEKRATVIVSCEDVQAAARTARAVEALRIDLEALDFDGGGTVWARLAGRADAIDGRVARLTAAIGGTRVPDGDEARIWSEARDFAWAPVGHVLVRIPLSAAAAIGPIPNTNRRGNDAETRRVRYSCGGRLAWVATDDLRTTRSLLSAAGLRGTIVRGIDAGRAIGHIEPNPFEDRVRRVLDPRNRFRAASDPH